MHQEKSYELKFCDKNSESSGMLQIAIELEKRQT